MATKKMKVDVISPVYNEMAAIETFLTTLESELSKIKNADFQIILVNDGSTDETCDIVLSMKHKYVTRLISFSRNFGHQSAVWAGIENSRPESYVVVLDSDLQDHPREIKRIIEAFRNKSDIVLMKRSSRRDFLWKRITSQIYYSIQNRISGNSSLSQVADFYGLAPKGKFALLEHSESIKYIRGLVTQLGFEVKVIEYERLERQLGSTHYTLRKMFSLAIAGITGFSVIPLLWVVYLGITGTFLGTSLILYILFLKYIKQEVMVPGWAFTTLVTTFFMVSILVSLSVISIYIARIVQEQKARPIYIVSSDKKLS